MTAGLARQAEAPAPHRCIVEKRAGVLLARHDVTRTVVGQQRVEVAQLSEARVAPAHHCTGCADHARVRATCRHPCNIGVDVVRRQLAVGVVAPATQCTHRGAHTGVRRAGADLGNVFHGRVTRATVGVAAPALHAADSPQRAHVVVTRLDVERVNDADDRRGHVAKDAGAISHFAVLVATPALRTAVRQQHTRREATCGHIGGNGVGGRERDKNGDRLRRLITNTNRSPAVVSPAKDSVIAGHGAGMKAPGGNCHDVCIGGQCDRHRCRRRRHVFVA